MGSISTQVPESWKIPLFYATVDGSMAGTLTQNQAALLVGQMNVTGNQAGTAALNAPIAVGSPALGQSLFGRGSMLDRMIQAFFAVNVNQLLYVVAVADPGAGAQAAGTITISHAPSAAGTLSIYIAGQLVQVAVGATDIVGTVATNLAAAIYADLDVPCTANAVAAVVTVTCLWKGLTGNDISIIPNYRGANNGEVLPTALTLTISAMAAGTAAPTFTTAIAALASFQYFYVGFPYTDTASELAWNTEYGFTSGGRWNYSRQQYGQLFNAYRAVDYATAITFGNAGPNSPVMSTMVIEPLTPSPVWEVAASYAGLAAIGFSDDPARPLQTLELVGIVPASIANRFSQSNINNLANAGLAVQAVAPDGNMAIMVEQTTYFTNVYGQSDTAFGLCTVLSTLSYILSSLKASITSKYPRSKLVASGTAFGPGQSIVTPAMIQAELVSEYRGLVYNGVAQDLPQFIKNLIVQIDSVNPNRVNVLFPPVLSGQLRIFAALAQFRLLANPPSNS